MPRDDIGETVDWIIEAAVRGAGEIEIVDGLCQRLNERGLPILRMQLAHRVLHPVYAGLGLRWVREKGASQEDWARAAGDMDSGLDNSPFGHLFRNNLDCGRFAIESSNAPGPFPIIDDLRELGATDYILYATGFKDTKFDGRVPLAQQEGMLSSWTVDSPGGYTDKQLAQLPRVVRALGLAIKSARNQRMARTLLEVYLGKDTGRRVLSGEVERGSVQTISAGLWYCDMQGFTKIAEASDSAALVDMLNDYFDAIVTPIHEVGGEVLKFMGDGLMAIFKLGGQQGTSSVCRVALDTVEEARRRIAEVNRARAIEGKATSDFYIAIHLGDVQYGNIGSKERLDFTVVGPAVNKVSRIEAMCRPLEREVVLSSAFAKAAIDCQERLVSLGRYPLRGVREPEELFTLVPD
jgi:adenylate cyclase